jgi:hypothetical protein
LALCSVASYLYAVPTLVISDNNGNTTGPILVPSGTTTFSGVLGNWNFNVVTVVGAPPAPGGTVNNPYLDVNSIDRYIGSAINGAPGSKLTITFLDDNLGPLLGDAQNATGGTTKGTSDLFEALVNGAPYITSGPWASVTSSSFSDFQSKPIAAGAGTTLGIRVSLTAITPADSTHPDTTSFNDSFEVVPDGGVTVALLGFAMIGIEGLRRKLKK